MAGALFALCGCGDDEKLAVGDAGAARPGRSDAGISAPVGRDSGIASPDGGDAGLPDSGTGFPDLFGALKSNPAGIRVVQQSEMGLTHVRMTSSNLENLPNGGLRWFGEIRTANESWCDPNLIVRILNADGVALWEATAEVRSGLHLLPSQAAPALCVAGDETTVAWAVDLEAGPIDPSEVAAVGIRVGGEAIAGTVPHPAAPRLQQAEVVEVAADGGVAHAVQGTLVGGTQAAKYVAVEAFTKGAGGWITDVLRAVPPVDPGHLAAGEIWSFTTSITTLPVDDFNPQISFAPE
jgi:hypothetical protein